MKTASLSFLLSMLTVGYMPMVSADDTLNQCLLTQLATADDHMPVGQIRPFCE